MKGYALKNIFPLMHLCMDINVRGFITILHYVVIIYYLLLSFIDCGLYPAVPDHYIYNALYESSDIILL